MSSIYLPFSFGKCSIPIFEESVKAGFPSPADGYTVKSLDLNEHLIKNQPATFILYASGDSMIEAGISDGDMLIVDRSIEPHNGSIVIAELNGEFTVKYFFRSGPSVELRPANDNYPVFTIGVDDQFAIIGVVCWTLRKQF